MKKYLRWGFTLLELLIVLVILAVLAGLALPVYASNVERMRAVEALEHLMSTRRALFTYYTINGTYTGAYINAFGTNLDFDPNSTAGGSIAIFSYSFSAGPTNNSYTVRARRLPGGPCGALVSPYSVYIDEAGRVTYS